MANQPYIVIRLVPESPVDGATFATYLDGLTLQVLDANTLEPRSDVAYSSPLTLFSWLGLTPLFSAVSVPTSQPTAFKVSGSNKNYGHKLDFNSTDGISVGSYAFSADQTTIKPDGSLRVTSVSPGEVQLKGTLPNYVPAGTVVSFLGQSPGEIDSSTPGFSFPLNISSAATMLGGELLVLHFADARGVTAGMTVTAAGNFIADGTTVAETNPPDMPTEVIVSQRMSGSPSLVTFTQNPPFASFSRTPKSGTGNTLTFANAGDTDGIAVGMTLSPDVTLNPVTGYIYPGTEVTSVDETTVTLSRDLQASLPNGMSVTFSFPLSSGIVQHVESYPALGFDVFGPGGYILVPSAVATAIVPLNQSPPLPDYLDIKISATRGSELIPVTNTFYNVQVSMDDIPTTPDQIQGISVSDTSLYVSLPPQPGTNPVSLEIPGDGSAPPFDDLRKAMQMALANDPILDATIASLITSPAQCTRIAYDIVWSYQNALPAPPDPLESLYTNPPNPGGGGTTTSGSNNSSNNFEQDRQKFEGTLSSFYSTRNASAERLTKFVAAASAAIACEAASLNSPAALLEFPVDPSSSFAAAVNSELLVQGLGVAGPSGLNFGVPAAFFYALGSSLDKSTAAAHRFQMATGEAIERLLQQFATAENAMVIKDSECFADTSLDLADITSFQAARRLVALGVSAASNSPAVTVFAGSPLAALINDWLAATAPLPQNPPLTYQNTDFNIWTQQLAVMDPDAYVDLDLDALTQGYIIPPFAAYPSVDAASGSTTLTFGPGTGIGAGMPVAGTNIAPGTTVTSVIATVTLDRGVPADVPSGSVIAFASVSAKTAADCPSGTTLLTFGPGGAGGISAGMPVVGPNIGPGTTVLSVTGMTVTLSAGVAADVPKDSVIGFAPVSAATIADCPSGTTLLTFGPGGADGIDASASVAVFGANIAAGTTVQTVAATTVTLNTGITGDVSTATMLVFNVAIPPVSVTTTADCPSGTTLLTLGPGGTDSLSPGMAVFGANIAAGTTVHTVGATTVTLSTGATADVPNGSAITLVIIPTIPLAPVVSTTTADCPPSVMLTFGPGVSHEITAGMLVLGPNIGPGTTVQKVAAPTVTLDTGVTADVPSGSVIAFASVWAATAADCPSGTILTFAPGGTNGVTDGMAVLGPNVAAGTTVQDVEETTVTLSTAVSADVPGGAIIAFDPTTATTTADCPPGKTLTFGRGGTNGIIPGMPVLGPNITPGTTVQKVTATTVTLSAGVPADVPPGSAIIFAPLTATTAADCPAGNVLTVKAGGTIGVTAGMPVLGLNIALGTTVQTVTATKVTIQPGVQGDVPKGSVIVFATVPSTLADQVEAWLPSTTSPPTPHPTVATIRQVTATQWSTLFNVTGNSQWLPPFTQPREPGAASGQPVQKAGYIAARIRAFIRAVHQFFTVSSAATQAQLPPADLPPTFDLPAYDPIGQTVTDLSFTFGGTLTSADLTAEAQTVFTTDLAAQAWLAQAMTTINYLYEIASAAPDSVIVGSDTLPYPVSFRFSVMEALYARGFRNAEDINRLTLADFQSALTGTVAYDYAGVLYTGAQGSAPPQDGAFQPVNPDGSLVNCIPPPCLSPTGPIAYLQEMLALSELSRCDARTAASLSLVTGALAKTGDTVLAFISAAGIYAGMSATGSDIPAGTTVTGADATSVTVSPALTGPVAKGTSVTFTAPTLGTVLSQRRGPVGNLLASRANLETPLPLIDLVNECLEYLGANTGTAAAGTVYNTGVVADEDPARLLAARPEHATPATPGSANASVEPAVFDKLKQDFSSCLLPYSQALDVSRSYLGQLGSSRFTEMRTFRKCITEFVLDPTHEPAGFRSWLWRQPVRADIAIEYLGITPEEYTRLFEGAAVPPCATPLDVAAAPLADVAGPVEAPRGTITLPAFLAQTCLSYCEFYDLWQSGYVPFRNGADQAKGSFPPCEPCCPEDVWLQFPDEKQQLQDVELLVFVRLWRTLRDSCRSSYSFAQLRDICDVLKLHTGGALNPDFIRQLAAFQMLRDDFDLDLTDPGRPAAPGAVDADRTHLLALWVGPTAAAWPWAERQLIARVEQHARRHYDREPRPAEFIKLLTSELDRLSRLAGFDPASDTDSWHAQPTHTLRFAELLAKICASRFGVDELIYLFTADEHLGRDPFPRQDDAEAREVPLSLPDDDHDHDLWRLRHEMLQVRVGDDEDEQWPWPCIEAALHAEFGFTPGDITALGEHFFPAVLARSGHQAGPSATRFVSGLNGTSAAMWNNPPDGPLRYEPSAHQLWTCVPLTDRAVITKLATVQDLNQADRQAVQDLFFQPRAMLATFAVLFEDFATAQRRLIEDPDEVGRFGYFRRQFLLCRRRSQVIARHLTLHVAAATGQDEPDGDEVAARILRALAADENAATTGWEDDSGVMPALTWTPPDGGALAALLGLAGTGLAAEFRLADGAVVWRDASGPLSGFGAERDRENCPVPTVLPDLGATLTSPQLRFASIHNGLLMKNATDTWLGGAQGFTATWSGVLLVEEAGAYEFWGGAPTPDEDRPDFDAAEHRRWRVALRRGQHGGVILSHHWAGEEEHRSATLPLRRGTYELTVELVQPTPELGEQMARQHTGFQLKYSGPDSEGRCTEIPHHHLFMRQKDQPLGAGLENLSPGAAAYLGMLYLSSLRDIRRTYQRAFKALLFARRFALSARREPHGTSELGYLLTQAAQFAGVSYYRSGDAFTCHAFTGHAANFDVNFLPLLDEYHPPAHDARTAPSPQRTRAMFDWWERMFDYTTARADVRRHCERSLWHLFQEAQTKQPADPSSLLRHLGADARHWPLDLRYFQGQNVPVYTVTSTDLEDERWTLRAWHADRRLRTLQRRFTAKDIAGARPDLWACDDPSAELPDESQTGNANLLAFVTDGYLNNDEPRRYEELRRLNDGLRDRGRRALVAYLCQLNRVALPGQPGQYATSAADLSDLLLLDVEAGLCEKASRIEEAITAAQSFVRRSQLGLEPAWTMTREFARLWRSRFETYRTWERGKRRELYRENWIEWDELARARRIEAFRFLESRLRTSTLTLAAPGGLDWWAEDGTTPEHVPELLQRRVPAELRTLTPPPQPATALTREGFVTLGSPEYAAQPAWLAAVPPTSTSVATTGTDGTTTPDGPADPAAPTVQALVRAAAEGGTQPQPQPLPLWMEAAMKLGTKFVRVAAAGVPEAALGFVPHADEPRGACCRECGREHPVVVDEYYFWLVNTQVYSYTDQTDAQSGADASFSGSYQLGFQDSYYDRYQQQSAEWDDENQVPSLLAKWQPDPAARLAWCRVHNNEFGQPRRSEEYVTISTTPDLIVLGRAGDSLWFQVTGSAPPPAGYGADPSPPGFRYDLPSDHAVALPQVLKPPMPATPSPYPGGLLSYPYFAYHEPGARLFPGSWFPAALVVADALRARCRFDLAARWSRQPFDPLQSDCTWVHCPSSSDTAEPTSDEIARQAYLIWQEHGRPPGEEDRDWVAAEAILRHPLAAAATADQETRQQGACCDSTNVTEEQAQNRAVTLRYCQTLLDWGDALMRRRSAEAFQQARLLYDTVARITGVRPKTVMLAEPATTPAVSAFVPAYAPLNPQLLDLYDLSADRRELIHRCLDARRLRNGEPGRDMPYFGNSQPEDWQRTAAETCAEDEEWCGRPSPYRFLSQIQKATELAGRVRELGAALLAAYEKGDAEYLASIRAEQEREMLALGVTIRQDQWRDADWQVQALQQTKDVNQTNLLYYANLYQVGPINNEIQNLSLTTNALQTRTGANETEVIGELMNIIPDFFVGALSTFSQVPIGSKLAGLFQTIAKVMLTIADIQSTTAGIDMTSAGWQRRSDEWFHQMQTLPIEIQQIELQILGAHRRRDQALQELNNQQRQIEHASEVLDFLRDKFTATELYLWLQKETAALHSRMYELAIRSAREAQRAFNFERGHTHRRFIPDETWDNLHDGLIAGERLEFALRHMEKAYLDENRREYELTKHISLRLDFPAAYLRLRTAGQCEISIPEWMFDLDYPGHYMRRIAAVKLTAPVVTSAFTGVHCRVTLLSSMTRIHPETRPPAHHCCGDGQDRSEYEPCPDDPRIVRDYAARESIATSSGQDDPGLFELNFRDERYLPFEYQGAVSRWRIELPPENNYFDLDTLTDLVLHVSYRAREGGAALRDAAAQDARRRLPGDGLRLFDVRHDFPDAWPELRGLGAGSRQQGHEHRRRRLRLGFTPRMFPFVPERRVLGIDGLVLMFAAPDDAPGRHHLVRFWSAGDGHDEADRDDVIEFECVADEAWPGFFCGTIDLRERPLHLLADDRPTDCTFEFPAQAGDIRDAFVVAHYETQHRPRNGLTTAEG
jgi:hypothetical protein